MKAHRRTFAEVAAAAVSAERAAVVAFITAKGAETQALIARGAVDAESGSLLIARLEAIGGQIDARLHLNDQGREAALHGDNGGIAA